MTIVQINPSTQDEHGVERCEPAQAMFYGVYIGQPGEYVWAADFADPAHAREFARCLITKYGYELEDNTRICKVLDYQIWVRAGGQYVKYSIRIPYKDGFAYLWRRGKIAWRKRTATKYLSEWNARNPETPAELEEAE